MRGIPLRESPYPFQLQQEAHPTLRFPLFFKPRAMVASAIDSPIGRNHNFFLIGKMFCIHFSHFTRLRAWLTSRFCSKIMATQKTSCRRGSFRPSNINGAFELQYLPHSERLLDDDPKMSKPPIFIGSSWHQTSSAFL